VSNYYRGSRSFRRNVALVGLVLALGPSFLRAEPLPPELDLIPRDAALFVSVRIGDLWNDARMKPAREFFEKDFQFEEEAGFKPADVERLTIFFENFGAGIFEPRIEVTFSKPYNLEQLLKAWDRGPPDQPARKHDLKAKSFILGRSSYILVNDRTFVMFHSIVEDQAKETEKLLAQIKAPRRAGVLGPAVEAAAGKHVVVVGCNIPSMKNALPPSSPIDFLPLDALLSSRSASLILDQGEAAKITLRVDAPDAATAKRVHDVLKAFQVLGLEMLPGVKRQAAREEGTPLPQLIELFEPMLQTAKFEQEGSVTTMTLKSKGDLAAVGVSLATALQRARFSGHRTQSQSNLRQIGIALFTQQDATGEMTFGGVGGKKEAPNLSWRVAILPYLDQQALYEQFKLDEPWDSAHNKKLIEKMPKVYAPLNGVKAEKGYTFLQTFVGPHALQPIMKVPSSFPDGAATTILVIEAGEAVPWTKPGGIEYDPKKPLPKLGGIFGGDFNVMFGDGSVRLIPKNIPEKALRAMITPAGGDVVDWDPDKK